MHFLSLAFLFLNMPVAFNKKDLNTTTWFSLEKLIHLITGVFIIPKIFNTLGAVDIGKLKFAESILDMCSPLFFLGLSTICVREIIFNPKDSQKIIATAFYMRLASYCIATAGITAYLVFTNNTALFTIYSILIFGYMFRLTDVAEYYFLAKKQAKFIFMGKIISLFCIVILQYYGVKHNLNVYYFAQVIVLDFLLQGFIYIFVLKTKKELQFKQWKPSKLVAKNLLIMAFPLIISEAFVMIYIGIDEVFLKYFYNDEAIGIFASVQFLVIGLSWTLGFAIINALYPSLAESFETDRRQYQAKTIQLFIILIILGLSIALFYMLFGHYILTEYFSEQYKDAKTPLQIFCWAPLFVFIGMLYEKHLLTTNRLNHNVYRFILGCLTNLILCFVLIPKYYINGAAIAVLISHFVTNIGYIALDKKSRNDFLKLKTI